MHLYNIGQTCFKSPIDDNSSDVWSIAWTSSGTQIAALTKSKELVIFDPRTNPDLAVRLLSRFCVVHHVLTPDDNDNSRRVDD